MGRASTTPIAPTNIKGILKKEDAPPKPKKSLVWKEGFIAEEPDKLSRPSYFNENLANDLEQENFRQVWREVSSKKLNQAARVLQKFARKFMLCWILTNDRRTELYEELEYIEERFKLDLERLEWEKEDMEQEAKLAVQVEAENGTIPDAEVSEMARQLQEIKKMQGEIRSLKQSNERMKNGIKSLKKTNKQLGYDLKEKAPAVEMSKYRVSNLEENNRKYQHNHDQYAPNIKKWEDSIDKIAAQQYECKRQGILYRNACLNILHRVRKRYPRKRVLDPIVDIMNEEFIQYYPVPDSDDEFEEPPAPPPAPPLPSIVSRQKSVPVGTKEEQLAQEQANVTKPRPNVTTGRKGVRRTKRHSSMREGGRKSVRKSKTDSELFLKAKMVINKDKDKEGAEGADKEEKKEGEGAAAAESSGTEKKEEEKENTEAAVVPEKQEEAPSKENPPLESVEENPAKDDDDAGENGKKDIKLTTDSETDAETTVTSESPAATVEVEAS